MVCTESLKAILPRAGNIDLCQRVEEGKCWTYSASMYTRYTHAKI